MTAMTVHYVHS